MIHSVKVINYDGKRILFEDSEGEIYCKSLITGFFVHYKSLEQAMELLEIKNKIYSGGYKCRTN
jgi:hypothetical protein